MRLRLMCAAVALGLAACGPGTSVVEKMDADQLFARGDAELKAHHWDKAIEAFDRLTLQYPSYAYADDARYGVCRAYEKLSPKVQLDQQYTQSAIDHCNSLLAYYPNSPFVGQAKEVVQRLTEKLAEKGLLAGEFYFLSRHAYDSSLIYFQDVVKTYPGTNAAAQALLRMVQVYQKLGYKDEEQAARDQLMREYPSSQAAKTLAATGQARS